MKSVLRIALVVACLSIATIHADDATSEPTTVPATLPATTPSTQAAMTADELDQALINKILKLEKDRSAKLAGFRNERVDGLRRLIKEAVAKKDDAGASRLRSRLAIAEAELKTNGGDRAAFEKAITNTAWTWANETIKLNVDGTVTNEGWTSRGLVTSWKVIDRRTLLLFITKGRDFNRSAVLTFNSEGDSYSGFNFEGTALDPGRRK